MSRVLTYKKTNTTISSMDGTVVLSSPLRVNINKQKAVRLIKLNFSSNIPNVFNYGGTNTGLIKVSKDNGATWDTIQLTDGIYTVALIQAAILSEITGYWTDASDPGFALRYNTATQVVYCDIDSTKLLVPSQFVVDFAPTGSSLMTLLGFVSTTSFNTDGIHDGSDYAQINWFGNSISCILEGFGYLSIVNSSSSYEIANVPVDATSEAQFVYPDKFVAPWVITDTPNQISQYQISFRGRNNRVVYMFDGECNLSFQLKEISA